MIRKREPVRFLLRKKGVFLTFVEQMSLQNAYLLMSLLVEEK